MSQPGTRPALRPFIIRILVAAAILGLIALAWYLRGLLMLAFGAVLTAVILRLIARPFHRRLDLRPGVALAIAVLLVAALAAGAFWLFGAEMAEQTRNLGQLIPSAWASLQQRLADLGLGGWLPDLARLVEAGRGSLARLGHFAVLVGSGIADTLLVLVGGVYLAAQPDLYRTGLIKLIPASNRALAAEAIDESGAALGLWLKGRLVSMAVVGLMTGVGLSVIGVPSALSLALLSALLEFIPFIGPIVSAVPAVLLALAHSPEAALWTALLYLIVQQIEGNVLEPLVQQQAVTIPPAVLLFALVAAGLVFGLTGIFFGAPLAVVLYVLVKRLYVQEALDTATPLPTEKSDA